MYSQSLIFLTNLILIALKGAVKTGIWSLSISILCSILLVGQEVRFSILKQVFEPPIEYHLELVLISFLEITNS